jgi:hypothetical protein
VKGTVKRNIYLLQTLVRAVFAEKALIQSPYLKRCSANREIGRNALAKGFIRGHFAEMLREKFAGDPLFWFHGYAPTNMANRVLQRGSCPLSSCGCAPP